MSRRMTKYGVRTLVAACVLTAIGLAVVSTWPAISTRITQTFSQQQSTDEASLGKEDGHDHGSGAHSSGAHGAESSSELLEVSSQALLNLGLTTDYLHGVRIGSYRRTLSIPAVVVPRPGRTQIVVASPLSGLVTHVHSVTGEAVRPGDHLFDVRLTYEDLVETQTAFIRTLGELQVEEREIARLEQIAGSGAISGRSLLERTYAREKLMSLLKSQHEALRLHGLSDEQIESIKRDGRLLRDLEIVAPAIDEHAEHEELRLSQNTLRSVSFQSDVPSPSLIPQDGSQQQFAGNAGSILVINDLRVSKGQAVKAGEQMCSLADYSELFIEGRAFEQDIAALTTALQQGWAVEAVFPGDIEGGVIRGLKLAYISNSVDPESRTLSFFVELPNTIERDETNAMGQRFVTWKYRAGVRLQLEIPVEQWDGQILLPVDAVAQDGVEWFVFQKRGNGFVRLPVHVLYRDQTTVVVANDGAVRASALIAHKGAHQLLLAYKNRSGGGVDPHAGHNH